MQRGRRGQSTRKGAKVSARIGPIKMEKHEQLQEVELRIASLMRHAKKCINWRHPQSSAPKRDRSQGLADVFGRKTSENTKKKRPARGRFFCKALIYKDF